MIRVLVADDQRINRVLLSGGLDPSRYEVVEAVDGREAVEKFDIYKPDVVLLDVMMPQMDGFEATRVIKGRLGQDHVPIILVTSLTDEQSLSQGMEAGADDFIPKPFNRMVLESKMKAALRIRSLFKTLNSNRAELQLLHEQSRRERTMAAKLMASALQTTALSGPMFKFRSRPMDVFNGDLLMAAETEPGKIRVVLGDFAGHGLAAAIGSLPLAMDFEQLCRSRLSLPTFARRANTSLRAVLPRDRFLAAAIFDINLADRVIDMINAGMPSIFVRKMGGGLRQRVDSTHFPLAVLDEFPGSEPPVRIHIEPGDRLYVYSDGITEAQNSAGLVYGEERFETLIASEKLGDSEVFQYILNEHDAFVRDTPPDDDVTLMEVFPDVDHEESQSVGMPNILLCSRVFHIKLELSNQLLRSANINHLIESILQGVEPLEGHRASIFAILIELLTNAIDHGLLRLDSRLKHSLEGFSEYYEERERGLKALEEGTVMMDMDLRCSKKQWSLDIEVRDTGSGFNIYTRSDTRNNKAHGRGIMLVEGLCERVQYFEPGNRVQATYMWDKTS
ncbi:MAG: fused response regulator/phosphatase [Myxococcales bacterium]|nr:fused response regulator/phosphatase [Myxococcales bacterium]